MNHRILKKYMMQFSTEELKQFLGKDLVDSLLEWNTGNEAFASKSRLSDMILCIYGTSILKIRILDCSFTKIPATARNS